MFKNVLCALVVSSLVGCASAPKVGERNLLDDPVVLKANSSESLRLAASVGFSGLRDLTKEEFADHSSDVEKLSGLTSRASSSTGVAIGTAGAGLAAGLSLSYVTGIGLLGALARDNRVDNYDFSSDFDSRYQLAWKGDSDILLGVIDRSLTTFSDELANVYSVTPEWRKNLSDRSTEEAVKLGGSRGAKVVIDGDLVSLIAIAGVECPRADNVCSAYFIYKVLGKSNPLKSRLVNIFSQEVGDSPLYLPPNREIYQLPAILQNGEMKYLVEQ